MKILVLGGTHFIGKAFVEHLLSEDAGEDITLFNRGMTNAAVFPDLQQIRGDRETSDLDKVLTQDWDCIVDVNGYYPNTLEKFIPKLKGKIGRYVYISTVSVYDSSAYLEKVDLVGENTPMLGCTAEQREGDWSQHYGEKKAECERILLSNDWLDSIILRPSIVYGKYDYTERFYYWLQRVKTRNTILIPENAVERGNLTFVDDLARIMKAALTVTRHRKQYNAVTHSINTLRQKLDVIASVCDRTPEFRSISSRELEEKEYHVAKAFPCVFGSDYLIYDITRISVDLGVVFSDYSDSIASAIEYYDKTTNWEPGSRGLKYTDEDALIESLGS